jgi:hypothetical protein
MYKRAGYERVNPDDLVYFEFTKSLNLHDGATKGRSHFLMCKHISEPTWLPMVENTVNVDRGTPGFEVAAY